MSDKPKTPAKPKSTRKPYKSKGSVNKALDAKVASKPKVAAPVAPPVVPVSPVVASAIAKPDVLMPIQVTPIPLPQKGFFARLKEKVFG